MTRLTLVRAFRYLKSTLARRHTSRRTRVRNHIDPECPEGRHRVLGLVSKRRLQQINNTVPLNLRVLR